MKALLGLGIFSLCLLLLGLLPLTIQGRRSEEGNKLWVKLGWLSLWQYPPKKPRKNKDGDRTSSDTEKNNLSQKKKAEQQKKQEKKQKNQKNKKQENKKEEERKKKKKSGKTSSKAPKPSLLPQDLSTQEKLDLAQKLLPGCLETLKKLGRDYQVDQLELEVLVGAEDPVEAVILYGKAHVVLGMLWQPVDEMLEIRQGRAGVVLSFQRPGLECYGQVVCSMPLWKLLQTALVFVLMLRRVLTDTKGTL